MKNPKEATKKILHWIQGKSWIVASAFIAFGSSWIAGSLHKEDNSWGSGGWGNNDTSGSTICNIEPSEFGFGTFLICIGFFIAAKYFRQ